MSDFPIFDTVSVYLSTRSDKCRKPKDSLRISTSLMLRKSSYRLLSSTAMCSKPILYSKIPSTTHPYAQFGHIQLNRPDARNALSQALMTDLSSVLKNIKADDSIRALIISSTSPVAFCAGADLVERRSMSTPQVSAFLSLMRETFTLITSLSVPTISIINGHALGGGLELALTTDFRLVGESAKVGLPETKLGIIPGAGGTQRLTKLVGPTNAKALIFTGKILDMAGAITLGIAQRGDLKDAIDMCESFTTQSPLAIGLAKRAVQFESLGRDGETMERGLDYEREMYNVAMTGQDREEGLLAFKEKRKPVYGIPKALRGSSKL